MAQRPVANGRRVEAGQLLMALDKEPFEAEYERIESLLREARFELEHAEWALAKQTQLFEKGAESQANLNEAKIKCDRARAKVRAVEAERRMARYQLEHSRVDSPGSGHVSELSIEVGDYVQAGQKLGVLSDTRTLVAKVLVSAEIRRGVEPGLGAEIIDTHGHVYPAVLARAAPVDSEGSGRFELELEADNASGKLLAGEPVRCRFVAGSDRVTYRVPREAVFERFGQWRAFVAGERAGERGVFHVRSVPIVCGETQPQEGWVQVLAGVESRGSGGGPEARGEGP